MVYLEIMSVAQIMWNRIVIWLANIEKEGMCKEAIVA
jgi:hypothetical protein